MVTLVPHSCGLREANDCHNPAGPGGGEFCGKSGKPRGPIDRGPGYQIVLAKSKVHDPRRYSARELAEYPLSQLSRRKQLTARELGKASRAQVALVFDGSTTAHLGAPVKWTAPSGVVVVYARGQRRSQTAEETGQPTSGVYHDFNPTDEVAIPLTQHIGAGRRALKAWAAVHATPKVTARFKARQMVRPGD